MRRRMVDYFRPLLGNSVLGRPRGGQQLGTYKETLQWSIIIQRSQK